MALTKIVNDLLAVMQMLVDVLKKDTPEKAKVTQ